MSWLSNAVHSIGRSLGNVFMNYTPVGWGVQALGQALKIGVSALTPKLPALPSVEAPSPVAPPVAPTLTIGAANANTQAAAARAGRNSLRIDRSVGGASPTSGINVPQ